MSKPFVVIGILDHNWTAAKNAPTDRWRPTVVHFTRRSAGIRFELLYHIENKGLVGKVCDDMQAIDQQLTLNQHP